MPRFAIFRILGSKPGCVDFLDEMDGESADEVESVARLMFDFDWAAGDRIDVEDVAEYEIRAEARRNRDAQEESTETARV